jgi:hypothetical protein
MSPSRFGLLFLVAACTNTHYANTTLVRVDPEAAGANCANGGVAIQTGLDSNHDGVLQDDEIDSTQFVCSAASPLRCEGSSSLSGIVTISSDAELAQLSTVDCIDGDLVVSGLDVSTIASMPLATVTGSIVIAGNNNLTSLDGFDQLTKVGRVYSVQANASLVDLSSLGKIERAGTLMVIGNDSLQNLDGLQALTAMPANLQIMNNPSLESLTGLDNLLTAQQITIKANSHLTSVAALDKLRSSQQLEISGNSVLQTVALASLQKNDFTLKINANPILTSISLPALATSSSVEAVSNPALVSISTPELLISNFFWVNSDTSIQTVSAPKLSFVTGDVLFWELPNLTTADFHSMTAVGGKLTFLHVPQLANFDGFSAVSSIAGDFTVQGSNAITSFAGMTALATVNGSLFIQDNTSLASFSGMSAMAHVEGNLTVTNNPALSDPAIQAFLSQISVKGTITVD